MKTTAAKEQVVVSYHRVRGLYFLTVVFAATIIFIRAEKYTLSNWNASA